VRLWDVATGKEQAVLRHPHWVSSVAVTEDGMTLASGMASRLQEDGKTPAPDSCAIKLWDVSQVLRPLTDK
jgi:WD40 repeat protein